VRLLGLAFLLLLLVPASADAQLLTLREHVRQMDSFRFALGADLNMFFGKLETPPPSPYDPAGRAGYTFFQPTVTAAFRLYEAVFEAAFPFAYYHENNDPGADHDELTLGHPWFGVSFLPDTICGLARLSLGIAPQLSKADHPREARTLELSRGAIGDWDGYLWRNRMLPLVLGVSTRKERERSWRLGWDADLIWGLPGGGRDSDFGAQTAGDAAVLFGWRTSLGMRLSASYYPTLEGDNFQSALTAYLRYARPSDAFGARFVLNLDGPAGFSFGGDGMWGAGLFYTASL
jgi:hypothetical protein